MLEIQLKSGTTPPALRRRPTLKPLYRHLIEAFYEVSSGRAVGELPQPIATSDILSYCELMGIGSRPERQRLFVLFRRLDGVYLREAIKKLQSPTIKRS